MTQIILLFTVLMVNNDIPKGIKDPDKWIAAKERRESIEAERFEKARIIRQERSYQAMLDRNERKRYYNNGGYTHPAMTNQDTMAQIRSMVLAESLRRTIYPYSNYSNNINNNWYWRR